MKTLKFFLVWMVMTLVMVITWSFGALIGDTMTQTVPPHIEDPANVGKWVIFVCLVNSLLWCILFWSIRKYTGSTKWIVVIVYLFGTQFFLMQIETMFFASSLAISVPQVFSILIAGIVMVMVTGSAGLWLLRKLVNDSSKISFKLEVDHWRELIAPLLLLSVVVYPLLYQLFGYFVAWQNEHLRQFYSGSTELEPFFRQLPSYFTDGLYFFQVLRGCIWAVITIPLMLLLRENKIVQYVLVALLSALPAVQLFIPNPYMPADIAFSHFVETTGSNVLWGLSIVYLINRSREAGKLTMQGSEA